MDGFLDGIPTGSKPSFEPVLPEWGRGFVFQLLDGAGQFPYLLHVILDLLPIPLLPLSGFGFGLLQLLLEQGHQLILTPRIIWLFCRFSRTPTVLPW